MFRPSAESAWPTFRRAFLWTLAAFALVWSIRADAAEAPALPDPEPAAEVRSPLAAADLTPPPAAMTSAPTARPERRPPPVESHPGATVTHFPDENWTVTIIPNAPGGAVVNGRRYEDVYASIPYSRAEYLANPGYRHEATLEILFGQLRPKTVVSEYKPRTVPAPTFSVYKPYRPIQTDIYRFWRPSPFSWNFPLTPYYPTYPTYPLLY